MLAEKLPRCGGEILLDIANLGLGEEVEPTAEIGHPRGEGPTIRVASPLWVELGTRRVTRGERFAAVEVVIIRKDRLLVLQGISNFVVLAKYKSPRARRVRCIVTRRPAGQHHRQPPGRGDQPGRQRYRMK